MFMWIRPSMITINLSLPFRVEVLGEEIRRSVPPEDDGGFRLLRKQRMNLPVKPIDSWSRGIRRRLLVESNFESLHPHESSSKANRQLVKRNPPSSSGGTALL
ncbi:unnamed protein product [Protopolystoma xenopodis]|uniref:Uncharacterized protein n=1 Tax=Protopolystoma xenopodis TaxID=117903 RepID=A0A448X989_9PLAT|nr:unnamed protein product [Protopolystoma xenopodis]